MGGVGFEGAWVRLDGRCGAAGVRRMGAFAVQSIAPEPAGGAFVSGPLRRYRVYSAQ